MVVHGRDGWELVEYEWDEDDGVGRLTYERVRTDTGEIQSFTRSVAQPSRRGHDGWEEWLHRN